VDLIARRRQEAAVAGAKGYQGYQQNQKLFLNHDDFFLVPLPEG
jgi:hypothetical protein